MVAPEKEHDQIMSTGATQTVTIATSSWELSKMPSKHSSYENKATFYFQVQGKTVAGSAARIASSKDKAWLVGAQITLHYLDDSHYTLEGENRQGYFVGTVLLYLLTAGLFCIAMMPFFYAFSRDEYERSILGETSDKKAKILPSHYSASDESYAAIQMSMKKEGTLASVTPIVVSLAIAVFLFCSTTLVFELAPEESPVSYRVGAVVSAVIAIGSFWITGVYLKRGKHANSYAYVMSVHDQIREYRRTKRSMSSKGLDHG